MLSIFDTDYEEYMDIRMRKHT